jgi:hypothetical protein
MLLLRCVIGAVLLWCVRGEGLNKVWCDVMLLLRCVIGAVLLVWCVVVRARRVVEYINKDSAKVDTRKDKRNRSCFFSKWNPIGEHQEHRGERGLAQLR